MDSCLLRAEDGGATRCLLYGTRLLYRLFEEWYAI